MDKRTRLATGAVLAALCTLAPATAAWGAEEFPKTLHEAITLYEGNADDWARGPVQYLMLAEEQRAWRKLESTEERREFIAWFWMRRDPESRDDRNPFMMGFYSRVAEVNERFGGMPRGWLSDRGHAWVLLGKPHSIRQRPGPGGGELTTWIYHVPGISNALTRVPNELHVQFVQTNRNWETIDEYGNVGNFSALLFDIFEQVNAAAIERPDLSLFLQRHHGIDLGRPAGGQVAGDR